ncbi:disulfide bond formation protein B [Candidatus Kaiserbacteria bacterium]|nr:disulfide bond formation protein B [Candidatus Kaiserbacteria bacterium]
MFDIPTVNYVLALGTVFLQIAAIALLVLWFLKEKQDYSSSAEKVGKWGLLIGLIVSFAAAFMNQYYNEVLGIPPCDLCWWGRIFLYPQIILFGMSIYKRDHYIADYAIVLSVLGAAVSLYHHTLQMFPNSLPCPATGVSCATRILFEFGYITYPLMAFSLFAFLIVMMLFVRASRSS